jgi:cytoskeletal protein CcmA (bactofilin family)
MIWRRDEQPAEQPQQQQPAVQRQDPVREARQERQDGRKRMAEDREVTIVGQGATLEGNVVSAGSLRIDGNVKGQINADGDVMLSPQSQVDADLRAENVTVAGRFKGNIIVKGTAELARGGRVDGNITSKTLVVQEGAIFQGQSIMDQQAAAPQGAPKAQAPAQAQGQPVSVPDAEKAPAKA